jgi:hypothetical protein
MGGGSRGLGARPGSATVLTIVCVIYSLFSVKIMVDYCEL